MGGHSGPGTIRSQVSVCPCLWAVNFTRGFPPSWRGGLAWAEVGYFLFHKWKAAVGWSPGPFSKYGLASDSTSVDGNLVS